MFFRELVNGALETGTLTGAGGLARLQGALSPTLRLVELVAQRLGDLSRTEQSVLEMLALGEPLGLAELTQFAEPAAVESLRREGADRKSDRRRPNRDPSGPPHLWGCDARRDQRTPRAAISRSLADVIEAVGVRRHGDPLKVATWRLVGVAAAPAVDLGGASAQTRHEYFLAERLARAAIEAGAGFEAHFVAAEAAHFQGRSDQADHELVTLAAEVTSDAEEARVALLRFDNIFFEHGADFQIIDDALADITDPFWGTSWIIAASSSRPTQVVLGRHWR